MPDRDDTTARLLDWARGHDPHVRAAVGLLDEHGHWLADDAFRAACIRSDSAGAYLDWRAASRFLDDRPIGSPGQLALLRIAVDLGSRRFDFARLDRINLDLVVKAFTQATRW